jgi:hypothetical protein
VNQCRQDQQPDSQAERLTKLEMSLHYERILQLKDIGALALRLTALETAKSAPPSDLDRAGWIKILLAVLIPLAVLLVTGSTEQALKALRVVAGAPG